ncbi:g8495 [Coccomyxa elongata]
MEVQHIWQEVIAMSKDSRDMEGVVEQRGGPTENSAALVESLKQANKEFVQQVITNLGVVCDSLVMRIEGLSKEFADVADESEDQQDNIALDADTAWQAMEDAYHEDLVELLRQLRMYQALGLSGPPDRIRHATLKERISNMRVLP